MKKISARRTRGFTLIELLAVIAIIGVLAAMTLGITGFVKASQAKTKASSEINMMALKLEEFKARNGDYPIPESDSEADAEATLFNALTGRWTYRTINGVRTWDKSLASGGEDKLRPFLEAGLVGTEANFDSTRKATKFIDPWGNAYRYRYGRLNAGKLDKTWDRTGFLLISAGAKYNSPSPEIEGGSLPANDYFMGAEASTGIIGNGSDDSVYFDDTYRTDNITNFSQR